MALDRTNFLSRLHEFVQHSGDIAPYLVESGTYSPLTLWESWHWQNEVNKKNMQFGVYNPPVSGFSFRLLENGDFRITEAGDSRVI